LGRIARRIEPENMGRPVKEIQGPEKLPARLILKGFAEGSSVHKPYSPPPPPLASSDEQSSSSQPPIRSPPPRDGVPWRLRRLCREIGRRRLAAASACLPHRRGAAQVEQERGRAQTERSPVDELRAHAPREADALRQRRVKIFDDSVGAVCRRQAAPPPAPPRAIGHYRSHFA
jgi:hypothetical protein